MKKILSILFVLGGIVSGSQPAQAGMFDTLKTTIGVLDFVLNDLNKRNQYSNPERTALDNLIYEMNVPYSVIDDLRRRGYSNGEIYSMLLLQRQSRQPTLRIIEERDNGLGWGQIAHRLGIHPGTFNKARKQWNNSHPGFYDDRDTIIVIQKDDDDRYLVRDDDDDWDERSKGKSSVGKEKSNKVKSDHPGKGHGNGHGNGGGNGKGKHK